ncbi:hypothetical protein ACCE15_19100 [Pseudomonas parafulva]|uniref:hypothetical protein n=1 Tax=Pseudomonas parafulva TaxID=157782 RepID=UPI0035619FF4
MRFLLSMALVFWLVVLGFAHFSSIYHFGFSGIFGYPVAAYGMLFLKNHYFVGLTIAFCIVKLWYLRKEKRAV